MLDQAFEALKTYDWGTDRKALNPIDEAVVATQDDAAARKELETRLAAVLKTDVSRDAKDFVCRKLMVIGTAASVPALAALLPEKEHSHMARYALERIPAAEAAQALRDALPKLSGELKVGVIGSLGVRGDAASVPASGGLARRRRRGGRPCGRSGTGGDSRSGSCQGVAGSQGTKCRGGRRCHRRRVGLRRRTAGGRQRGQGAGRLQTLRRRRSAQARSPGGDPRHAGLRRPERLKRDLVLCRF